MKILLIEDDEIKRNNIVDVISKHYMNVHFEFAMSVRSAIDSIKNNSYDILLLDMTLPTYDISAYEDGGRPQHYGGREILRQMNRILINTPTILVTGFDKFGVNIDALSLAELDTALRKEHDNYVGSVHYGSFDDSWIVGLLKFIDGVIFDDKNINC